MATLVIHDIHLHFIDEGQGEPIVLVHGFPLSTEMWRPQRAVLAGRYRVLSVDLRGHGGSDPPTGAMTIETYADDIVALLDSLGIGQATIAGLSMGGYVTMALLRRHPERVRAVILLDTKMTPDTEAGKQGRNDMIQRAENEGAAAIADAMLPKMLTEATRQNDPELVEFARNLMASTTVPGIVGALQALRDRPDSTPALQAATVPALIVVGSDDTLTPPSDAAAMQAVMQQAQLQVIPGAAHLSTLEQPAAVNEALLAFLDQHVG